LLFELGKLLPQIRDFFLKIGGVIAECSDLFFHLCDAFSPSAELAFVIAGISTFDSNTSTSPDKRCA